MKILAFNASPRKEKGTTEIVLNLFLKAASEAGADTEKIHLLDKDIKGCLGCFSCWWKTPGKCAHRDDMDEILPKIRGADAVVLGTPIYHYNIVHYLQRMRERTLPLALPDMVIRDGQTVHPSRYSREKPRQTVIIAVCGFPDLENFNQVKGLFPDATWVFLPASWMLQQEETKQYLFEFMEAVKKAGIELVEKGRITPEIQGKLVVDYPIEFKEKIIAWVNTFAGQETRN